MQNIICNQRANAEFCSKTEWMVAMKIGITTCVALSAAVGMAAGLAGAVMMNTPEARRMYRIGRRKVMQCAKKMGI